MDKRIIIGLLFSYDEKWIGGSYYIMNLIQSLKLLEDKSLPKLIIISKNEEDFLKIKQLNYPYINYKNINHEENLIPKIINKISRKIIFKRNIIKNIDSNIDLLFPSNGDASLSWIKKQLFWIPDFQELHLPQFYPNANLEERKSNRKIFSKSKKNVVFSSKDALNDYNFFFKENNTKNYVLNFSVFHPKYDNLNQEILKKHNLNNKNYFFSPNQFWKHKNQIIILKALVILKNKNKLNFTVAFSGKEYDYRNPEYFQELKDFTIKNDLQENILFLGFIDREEQLYLMKNSLAIIQPSLFEGWSTVVEDTKSMNQNCIVSDLNVHKEQLKDKGYYFNPCNENQLAEILLKFNINKYEKPDFDYEKKSQNFGYEFIKIANDIINS
ncbi:glycosyltransferase [Flavobacterium sp.]|uniref:glycosyltransferase n=1 Tax=Flavobacterium sp. TaxID=239 RepID=UPI0037528483